MEENNRTHRIKVGEKFSSFQEFLDEKKKYEEIVKQVYTINGNQRKLSSNIALLMLDL